ncbi:MAG: hypothetical protein Q9174_006676, partial [Haloplaca sp. 1 TL-2023]
SLHGRVYKPTSGSSWKLYLATQILGGYRSTHNPLPHSYWLAGALKRQFDFFAKANPPSAVLFSRQSVFNCQKPIETYTATGARFCACEEEGKGVKQRNETISKPKPSLKTDDHTIFLQSHPLPTPLVLSALPDMSAQTLPTPALPVHDPLLNRPVDFAGAVNTDGAVDGREGQPKLLRGDPSKGQCVSIMPGQTTSQPLLVSLASPMVGREIEVGKQGSLGSEVDTNPVLKSVPGAYVKQHSQNSSISSQLFRRDSASTFTSADSSPTTTVSTMDSALTEPSPSSSPESATSMLPIASFKSLSTTSVAETGASRLGDSPASPFPTMSGLQRADSPGKKMRNMKNLSVNTSASTRQAPQLPKLSFRTDTKASGNHAVSAPPTPSFIVPPKPPRKRPSNLGLSITTPESSASSQANDGTIQPVPATPADPQPRMIRYLQTSSTMPVVSSPTVAPEGGMRLPPFGNVSIPARGNKSRPPLSLSRHSSVDSQASPIRVQMLEHVQEESDYDLPLSREAKSPAYPQGPVCIYDPLVYLYLEPNDTEACDFDVVLNVARE